MKPKNRIQKIAIIVFIVGLVCSVVSGVLLMASTRNEGALVSAGFAMILEIVFSFAVSVILWVLGDIIEKNKPKD